MKKIAQLSIAAMALASIFSCQKDPSETIEAGLPAKTSFTITVPSAQDIVITKATDAQEKGISNIAFLFYKDADSTPVVIEKSSYDGTTTGQHIGSDKSDETAYTYTLSTEDNADFRSGEWILYAVANYNVSDFGAIDIEAVKGMTLAQAEQYCIKQTELRKDMVSQFMPLTGRYGKTGKVTIEPAADGKNHQTADNEYIHLRRITSKVNFTIVSGTGVTFTPESMDIVNYSLSSSLFERTGWAGTNGTSLPNGRYLGQEDSFATYSTTFQNGTTSFYMMENVQNAVTSFTDYNLRDKKSSATSFVNAPANATYVVINGVYSDSNYSGNVSYTIHLGDFSNTGSNDNFTIRRNTKYNYTVHIKGVNNIIIEATTGNATTPSTENNSGAEGYLISKTSGTTNIIVDAHYETIQCKIPAGINVGEYVIRVNTPYTDGVNTVTLKTGESSDLDVNWIHFMESPSATTVATYPGDGNPALLNVHQLMNNIGTFTKRNNFVYVTAFVDEYYYEGKPLTDFINKPNRELSVVSNISRSTDDRSVVAQTNILTIGQKSIKSFYNLNVANPLGMENIEEYPNRTRGDLTTALERNLSAKDFGRTNCITWINSQSTANKNWNQYFTLNKAAHFDNNSTADGATTSLTGLNQFISRNRDANGNGRIDPDEIKWYAPAQDECLTMWYGNADMASPAVNGGILYYWTSTIAGGANGTWWYDEGVAFGTYNKESKGNLRCVRTLKDYKSAPTPFYSVSDRTITISGLAEGITRNTKVTTEYNPHERGAEADNLPGAFVVANNLLSINGAATASIGRGSRASSSHTSMTTYPYVSDAAVNNGRETINITLTNGTNSTNYYYIIGDSGKSGNEYDAANRVRLSSDTITLPLSNLKWNGNTAVITFFNLANTTYRGTGYQTVITITRNTTISSFSRTDVMEWSNLCSNYSENGVSGVWRIPNEKELGLMFAAGMLTGTESSRSYYGRTFSTSAKGIAQPYFYNTNHLSTEHGESGYKIRCVRDL